MPRQALATWPRWPYLYAIVLGGGLALGSAATAAAQEEGQRITGRVVDQNNGNPVAAAAVLVTGTTIGAQTSDSGTFALRLPAGATSLTARRIGFLQKTVPIVSGQARYEIGLTADVLHLQEQVVTGVATTVSTRNSANDIAVVSTDQLAQVPTPTLENAIQGQVAGAQISQDNGGSPGGGLQVQIRGVTSIYAIASPLYVVDGVIVDNQTVNNGIAVISRSSGTNGPSTQDESPNRIADINPDDIESIEVLKGASASAIYGSKASAGVIVITTKKGAAGKPHWELSQSVGHFYDGREMGVRTFPTLQSAIAWGKEYGYSAATITSQYAGPQNYQSELFGNPGVSDETDLSVSGTQGPTQYFISGLTKYDNGIMTNTGYNKQSIRSNITEQFNSALSASANVFYAHDQTRRGFTSNDNNEGSPYDMFSYTPQFLGLSHPNADGIWENNPYGFANAFADAVEIQTPETVNRFIGGGAVNWTPFTSAHQSFQVKLIGGVDESTDLVRLYAPPDLELEQSSALPGVATAQSDFTQYINYSVNLIHHITLSAADLTTSVGFVRERRDESDASSIGQELVAAANNPAAGTVQTNLYTQTAQRDQSLYAQEEAIALHEHLALTAGITAERTTNDGNINQFYPFPRFSASYRTPAFLGVVDEVKLRAAYGQSGTQPLYSVRYSPEDLTLASGRPGVAVPDTTGDAKVAPEKETEIEVGFDATLFHSRAQFSATLYQKQVSNLLLLAGSAPSVGYSFDWLNGGEFTNHGIELSLTATPVQAYRGLTWVSTTSFYRNYSVVNSLPVGVGPFAEPGGLGGPWGENFFETGKSVTQIVNPGEVGPSGLPVSLGDVEPTFVMDFSNSLSWGSFRLTGVVEWSRGGLVSNYTDTEFDFGPGLFADSAFSSHQLAAFLTGLGLPFDETATFVKVRDISLSYQLPRRFVESLPKHYITSASLSLDGRNLLHWYRYTGLDPEVSYLGSVNVGGRGFDVTPFPPAGSYFIRLTVGL